jgi:protein-S-isoprenylcysteine O-methyltransferase Ste14
MPGPVHGAAYDDTMDLATWPASKLLVLCAWIALGIVILRRRTSGAPAARRDVSSLVGMAIQGVAFAIAWTEWPIGRPAAPILRAAAVLISFGSVWMAARAVIALGRHFSLTARTLEAHELVTAGPYAVVRHPIYAAMLGLLVATTITFGRPLTLVVSLPVFLAGTSVRTRREERLLAEQFEGAWTDYVARVPALLPRLK